MFDNQIVNRVVQTLHNLNIGVSILLALFFYIKVILMKDLTSRYYSQFSVEVL